MPKRRQPAMDAAAAPFDEAVILFDPVVRILALANPDRLQSAPRAVL
jgi:hypothetical protein